MSKPTKIPAKIVKDGLLIRLSGTEFLIIEDTFGQGLLVSIKPYGAVEGRRPDRPFHLAVHPRSTAAVVIEANK